MSEPLVPIITEVGKRAILEAIKEKKSVKITHIALGNGINGDGYTAGERTTELATEKQRVKVGHAEMVGKGQIHLTAVVRGPEEYWVRELGFYLEDGETLLAIYAVQPGSTLAYKAKRTDLLIAFDLALSALPVDSVTVDADADLDIRINTHSLDGFNGGPTDALFVDHEGRVGIGLKTPQARLDIKGTLHVDQKAMLDSNLIVKGKVGIGVASPKADLHIKGGMIADSLKINDNVKIAKNLTVGGKTVLEGDVEVKGKAIYRNVEQYEGDIHLGSKDSDKITVTGVVKTGHSSGRLQVDETTEISEDLIVKGGIAADNIAVNKDLTVGGAISAGSLTIDGDLDVKGSVTTGRTAYNFMSDHMYPPIGRGAHAPIVYQNIFEAKEKRAIVKLGTPKYYEDKTFTVQNPFKGRPLIAYGSSAGEADGNGAQINIPDGYDTVWIRFNTHNTFWYSFKAYFLDGKKENLRIYIAGNRYSNSYSPDGSLSDGYRDAHEWIPVAAGRSGKLAIVSDSHSTNNLFFSGLAFSKNPWNHAVQSAVVYHWRKNGSGPIPWDKHNWNNDLTARIPPGKESLLRVPYVRSDGDKLLYLVEHNSNWNGCMHSGITVNGHEIERFSATYDNPFARHWNSKIYQRYIAARIPREVLAKVHPANKYLEVKVDMRFQDANIYFREMGTHDLELPVF